MPATALSPPLVPRRAVVTTLWSVLVLFLVPVLAPAAASVGAVARGLTTIASGLSGGGGKIDPGLPRTGGAPVDVVISGAPQQAASVRGAIWDAGGTVTAELPLIDGARATVPAGRLAELASSPAVTAVTKNRMMQFEGVSYDATATASNFVRTSGASTLWKQNTLGDGIGVAVLDTGISPMNDLAGRIVYGPDLSGEGRTIDSFGHGTVMAGVIGGSGADSSGSQTNANGDNVNGGYAGVAPKSTLVSVKVAGRNGAADVSTMLQGMHWISAYKSNYNIRVLNLAWGTASTQSPTLDPLNYAVERLWQQGIVVVVAAGNSGPTAGTILKPGDDPLVLTVGAFDDKGNSDDKDDDVPPWSSEGPTASGLTKPDLVAPGHTLVSARSYGSAVETDNPTALVAPSYIKGSGTSQAAAVTSGAVALLLQAKPSLTPDQVKQLLTSTAAPLGKKFTANQQGKGRLDVGAALTGKPGAATQQKPVATGLGSIEASRGGMNIETDCGNDGTTDVISGEIDARCEKWDPKAWTGAAWTGAAWTGASWTGAAWTGAAWTGASWTGAAWTGAAWTGGTWTGAAWTGAAWTGASWTGSAWTGAAWTGAAWTGAAWTGAAWTGASWTGAAWTGASWTTCPGQNTGTVSTKTKTSEQGQFLTAWWGTHPKHDQKVNGEQSDP